VIPADEFEMLLNTSEAMAANHRNEALEALDGSDR
jgi:hypothetical protein